VTTSAPDTSAHAALREATHALKVRRDRITHADLTETGYRSLAADLADNLDAVAGLLRSVGVGVRPDDTTHGLLTVAEHVDMVALIARHAGGDHDPMPATTHLEPERCGATDV
jgi:hypothetical protein